MSKSVTNPSHMFHIIAFTFKVTNGAKQAKKVIKQDAKTAGVKILNAAIVTKDSQGKTKYSETADMSTGQGVAWGAGLMLVLTGGVGGVLLGAIAGGLLAKHRDSGIPDSQLRELASALTPNSSAILVLAEDKEAKKLLDATEDVSANIITLTLGDEESDFVAHAIAGDIQIKTNDQSNLSVTEL